MQIMSIATNVRRLYDDVKKHNLVIDMKRYFVDIVCQQETKIKNGLSKEDAYGLGFIVNEK